MLKAAVLSLFLRPKTGPRFTWVDFHRPQAPEVRSTMEQATSHDEFADKYTKTGSIGQMLIARFFDGIQAMVNESGVTSGKALEVGAGQGFSTAKLNDMLAADVVLGASEFLPEQVAEAKTRNPGLDVIEESVYDLQRPDSSIDLIFCLEVLEHLEEPATALKELARVSSQYVVISTPREPIWCALNMARGKYLGSLGNTPGHIQHWSTGALKREAAPWFDVVASRTPLPWSILLLKPRNGA